ncbi:hypothetical protein ABZ588_30955 [Streptomyces althioticus]|uniref:vWA-MoxR associated conflict system protein n=1 Tax=Streptomyces althioticus TaxID=83380 RepID=UPI0033D5562F
MTPSTPPRHLLVIAPQCPDQGLLTGLEETAESLHAVLLDEELGGCEPSPPDLPSLLCGLSVGRAEIDQSVRDAADRAGAAEAVLVIAFLGHGTTLGQTPKLAFMASDSHEDVATSVVDVGGLLTLALDAPGVRGVIAMVDTCRAGGAVPDLGGLAGGVRQGATSLSLLMSASAVESAHGLAYTRTLVRVLRDGLPDAGMFLSPQDVQEAVDKEAGTSSQLLTLNGLSLDARPWFARNARHRADDALLGPLGEQDLRLALDPLGDAAPALPIVTSGDLARLRRVLAALDRHPATADQHLAHALRTVDRLATAVRTREFILSSWPGSLPESERIRRAYVTAAGQPASASDGDELLRDCVESLCLRVPRAKGSPTAPLATFIAALAVEDGLAAGTPGLTGWARGIGAGVELVDAFAAQARRAAENRLRLVVSLHSAMADEWPETLLVWLLDGETLVGREDFRCPPTQAGVEQRLGAVLAWATRQARRTGFRLKHIDIAAPAALLACWRPEEARLGQRLGLHYDIVLRWSDRLNLPAHLCLINEFARNQLDEMKDDPATPVNWLDKAELSAVQKLVESLGNGCYGGALALRHRPERLQELLEPLLAYAPMVLWPDGTGDLPQASQDSVERNWARLPGEFSAAYRTSWKQGDPAQEHTDLARVRSVWLDEQWLDFCDAFANDSVDGENPR